MNRSCWLKPFSMLWIDILHTVLVTIRINIMFASSDLLFNRWYLFVCEFRTDTRRQAGCMIVCTGIEWHCSRLIQRWVQHEYYRSDSIHQLFAERGESLFTKEYHNVPLSQIAPSKHHRSRNIRIMDSHS